MENILISLATQENLSDLIALITANYDTETAKFFIIDFTDMFSTASIKPTFYVAKNTDGAVVGVYSLWSDTKDFGMQNLVWLNVRPEHQRKGIGKLLLRHAVATARDRGEFLLSLSSKETTREYYERFGFTTQLFIRERYIMSLEL